MIKAFLETCLKTPLKILGQKLHKEQSQEEGEKGFPFQKGSQGYKETEKEDSDAERIQSPVFLSSSYDTGQGYRSLAWVVRASTIGFVVSVFLNITLALCLFVLMPLKEVQPYLLALKERGDQVVHIEPIQKNAKGLNKLIEGLCRQYVTLRETIDCVTDEDRWLKHLYFLSSEEIWQDFASLMNPDSPTCPLKKYKEAKINRSVLIAVSSQISDTVYQVEWQSITTHQGQERERQRWVSTLEVELKPNALKAEDQFINPIGFTVTKYSVSKREEGSL